MMTKGISEERCAMAAWLQFADILGAQSRVSNNFRPKECNSVLVASRRWSVTMMMMVPSSRTFLAD